MNGKLKTIVVVEDSKVINDGNVYWETASLKISQELLIESYEFLFPKNGFELIYI